VAGGLAGVAAEGPGPDPGVNLLPPGARAAVRLGRFANTWLLNLHLSKQYVNLSGMSTAASDLIPLLDKSGLLKKIEFASPIVTDANKLEHFKIKAEF
jgi:hypothetical protein